MNPTPYLWLRRITESPTVHHLCASLGSTPRVVAEGAQGSSTSLLAGAVALKMAKPVLLVVAHLDDADEALEDLEILAAAGHRLQARRFGALEVLPGESSVSLELLAERLAIVRAIDKGTLCQSEPAVLVAPVQALMQPVPEPAALQRWSLSIERGQTLAPGHLLDWLDRAGYQRCDVIEQPGDFAIRGGIVDIYTPADDRTAAIRIDYFGDQVETISRINTDTMGSGEAIESAQVMGISIRQLQLDADHEHGTTSLLRLMPTETIVVLQEMLELAEQARGYYERLTDARGIYPPSNLFRDLTAQSHLQVNQYSTTEPKSVACRIPVRPLPTFDQSASAAVADLATLASDDGEPSEVVVLCQNEGEQSRLNELIAEHLPQGVSSICVELGYLFRGFIWREEGTTLHLIPHHELFHRYETRRRIRRFVNEPTKAGATDKFVEIAPGDHVVHVEHGIAHFRGLQTMTREGKTEEYLTLEFARGARLHVPAMQVNLIQKYIGGFHGKPPLSVLGGKRWQRQKQSVAEAVKDMAAELLRIQAARAALPGVRFPADTAWQHEFEAEFPYQETDDQVAAIAQMKKDMADEQPMDRLICGDVGFGKTEVAIRGAFKVSEFGKQVAVLVPTTVLAEQHERTFRERTAEYPFRIESISRFKTEAEQRKILKELAEGRIDVIIGTHRLLSGDVKFADLGLVVIDEEQRFGVEHKQKLLQFRLTADVMTLTATPIPRTLHMAMLGLRDISSLSTPPLDRRAIVTEVIPYDEQRVRQAIIREMNREGQVYFVHNRVHDIESVAGDVQRLAPDARLAIGHGQMSGRALEQVMLRFVRREVDVLVCTTIIESGIDIPTANTIIIDQADTFGLADLHQLRGRVGRYKHRAYCYLMLPRNRTINDTAVRRLKAIEQYSMLGAGFKIAMRDLEIRGAGNMLGAEQSGHIAAVGYEMYCSLLELESRRLRNEGYEEPVRSHIELPIAARLPPRYIASQKHRLDVYRRLSRATTLEQVAALAEDMTDAYGPPPKPATVLIQVTELRIAAGSIDVMRLKLDGPDLIFTTRDANKLRPLLKDAPGRVILLDPRTIYYRPPANYLKPPETLLAVLRKLLVTSGEDSPQRTQSKKIGNNQVEKL